MRDLAWVAAALICVVAAVAWVRTRHDRVRWSLGKPTRAERKKEAAEAAAAWARYKEMRINARIETRFDSRIHTRMEAPQAAADTIEFNGPEDVTAWSLDALSALEWKRFESLCIWYYKAKGFVVTTAWQDADGGFYATLHSRGVKPPVAVVQCRAGGQPVREDALHALAELMRRHQIRRGVFWSRAGFAGDGVQDHAAANGIQLLNGVELVARIHALDEADQIGLLARAFHGDYRSPTCAACGRKMSAQGGKGYGSAFWRCQTWRACGTEPVPMD
jgi:restriction system protein